MEIFDVIIIGSGPAGLTAAIYTTRANLKTLVIGGRKWGGQLMLTTVVENFPGFPEGIQGPDLMEAMRKQAEHHGAQILNFDFKSADYSSKPIKITTDDEKTYQAKTIIIATGADTKWLEVPGEKEKIGRGVSSCAPCDGAFFRNKRVIVVGGGDSAMEEALVMTKYATEVIIVHRKNEFRASQVMQERVKNHPKIHIIYNAEVLEVLGDQKVTGVKLKMTPSDQTIMSKSLDEIREITPKLLNANIIEKQGNSVIADIPTDGIFVAIGHMPNSGVFKGIETDEKGFIKVQNHTKTNVDGVFVAGDVHDATYKQAVTAAGFGCMAALEVEKFLMDN